MSNFLFDELMSCLQAREAKLNRSTEKYEDKTFQVKGDAFNSKKIDKTKVRRDQGRGAKNHDRGRDKSFKQRHSTNE